MLDNMDDEVREDVLLDSEELLYRVAIQVVPNLLLTSKQKFPFSIRSIY